MIETISQDQIREFREQGLSIRHIASKLGISRQSVRKYMAAAPNPTDKNKTRDSFKSYLKSNKEQIKELFFKLEGRCVPLLREIEEMYSGKCNLRAVQIFCKPFRKELKSSGETVPERYETQPGDHLQIDFGEKDVSIGGRTVRVHFFVGVLGYSRRIYVKAYTSENTDSWLNGIESAFLHFGGVPPAIVSDNTKCLVTVHNGQDLKLNERYKAFCGYWRIKPIVCTPYKPRSKGKCERMVRYFKENALPGKSFQSMQELQSWIDLWLVRHSDSRILSIPDASGGKTPAERFKEERGELRAMNRAFFTDVREETRKADKCGLVRIDNRLYQLPKECADQSVLLQITDTEIIFRDADGKTVRMDKTDSVYTAKLQAKSTPTDEAAVSPDFALWGQNALERPLAQYESIAGGAWQ